MDRIIISFSELSRNSWTSIYTLIKGIQEHNVITPTQNKNLKVSIKESQSQEPQKDICSIDEGELLSEQKLLVTSKDQRVFNLIYVKQSESEDFSRLVHFFLLKKEYGRQITLGIDVSNVESSASNSYYFKCSGFFTCIEDKSPLIGDKSIYFIFNKVNETTGELRLVSQKLAGKGDKVLVGNESRRFLPLLKINRQNFYELFLYKSIDQPKSKEAEYIKNSIDKISKELFSIDTEVYHSIFDEWFTKAYFYSLENHKIADKWANNKKIISVLHSYYHNIFEIVQNVIYHGNGQGLLYCAFSRKENLSEDQGLKIVNFDGYDSDERFLEIGVFDYGKIGIVDNYLQTTDLMLENESEERRQQWTKDKNDISLETFFDVHSILTIGITRTDLRYAANMGLKSFVNSLMRHNGYFRVETNSYNNQGYKDVVETVIDMTNQLKLQAGESIEFSNGTHYEIILPVKVVGSDYSTATQYTNQYIDLAELLVKGEDKITEIPLHSLIDDAPYNLWESSSKTEQKRQVQRIGDHIINKLQTESNDKVVALNLHRFPLGTTYIFKLLAYIQFQLQAKQLLILTHLDDSIIDGICDQIKLLLNDKNGVQIWNNNAPVVLISNKLRFQILSGETKNDFLYINELIKQRYPNQNVFKEICIEDSISINDNFREVSRKLVNNFYEFNIVDETGKSLFERYVTRILKQPVEGSDIGYCVSHEYTRIGSKMIIKNFYEADTLFQNTFYSERLAYLVAKSMITSKCVERTNSIILIGYKPYSESLVKSIKKLLNCYYHDTHKEVVKNYIIVNEDDEGNFTWKNNDADIINNVDGYSFVTIVPIGSTLSVHDKIIAMYQRCVGNEQRVSNIYNHCLIVVRDKVIDGYENKSITKEEAKHKWNAVDSHNRTIITSLQNVSEVHFTIQVAATNDDYNWYSMLDERFFPKNAWNEKRDDIEKYINDTHNSSLNSQNLMGYPRVIDVDEERYQQELRYIDDSGYDSNVDCEKEKMSAKKHKAQGGQYKLELARLETFRNYIHYGHIERCKSHFRNYFDTEKYVREQISNLSDNQGKESLFEWIKNLKKYITIFNTNVLNVLITPTIDIEPDFVEIINEVLFDNAALILHVDIQNWRNNIIHKYSYINEITKDSQVSFHFIDHVLLTGESYRSAKSYMRSILRYSDYEEFHFSSVITLINRLSYDRNKEIYDEIKGNVFSYLHLFVPHSSNPDKDCALCKLDDHYNLLRTRTIVESCIQSIHNNTEKIILLPFDNTLYQSLNYINLDKRERGFNRLCLTHMLYYEISKIVKSNKDIDSQKKAIEDMLERVYLSDIDRISFLKVISSPPLSQYIQIRSYAHKKLINELYEIFKQYETPSYDNYRMMCVVLKQLSFLKSNALVRKDVITKAWKLCLRLQIEGERIKEQIENLDASSYEFTSLQKELKRLNLDKVMKFKNKFHFLIKNAIFVDDAKSRFLGDLLRTGEEILENDCIKSTRLSPYDPNELFDEIAIYLHQLLNDDKKLYNSLKRQYVDFLVWLFYDNTTILQKTLQNFYLEVNKEKYCHCYNCFYDNQGRLKDCTTFITEINKFKEAFTSKVEHEYYYSSFKPYLNNEDKIDFVEKILYVLYAKLKLKEIEDNKHKEKIDKELLSLLHVFTKIMDADVAFFSMKYEKVGEETVIYPIAIWGVNDNKWNFDEWNVDKTYSAEIIKQRKEKYSKITYPMMLRTKGSSEDINIIYPNGKSINVLVIHDDENNNAASRKVLATITFIYKSTISQRCFRINAQESGRLLLLLKNDINKYVIDYLKNEKVFDMWVERHESNRRFKKIYLISDHSIGKYNIVKNLDLDELDTCTLNMVHRTYFAHTNAIINHLYSNIEQNGKLAKFDSGDSEFNEISDIFNDKFKDLIANGFKQDHWEKDIKNITIIDRHSNGATTVFNKQVLRTFVIQCLDNAIRRHLFSGEKNVTLLIDDNKIVIENDFGHLHRDNKNAIITSKEIFKIKLDSIVKLKCRNYECMTLTAIQGYCDCYGLHCEFRHSNRTFKVIINLNK